MQSVQSSAWYARSDQQGHSCYPLGGPGMTQMNHWPPLGCCPAGAPWGSPSGVAQGGSSLVAIQGLRCGASALGTLTRSLLCSSCILCEVYHSRWPCLCWLESLGLLWSIRCSSDSVLSGTGRALAQISLSGSSVCAMCIS